MTKYECKCGNCDKARMKTKTHKHTPGPYEVHMFDSFNRFEVQAANIGEDGEGVLCDLSTEFVKPQEAEANAHLFAAAPDQNAVLESLMEYWDHGTPVHPGALIVDEVRAVLANAKGV